MEDCNVIKRKKDKFSEMLMDIAQNIKDSAEFLGSFELQNVSDLKEFANVLKAYESKGDKYVHTVITELNKAFITPIEREDILQLAMSMDDVLDGIDSFAALMEIHSITTFDEYVAEFVKNIQGCAEEILITINLLSEKKLLQISEHAIKIKEYESRGYSIMDSMLILTILIVVGALGFDFINGFHDTANAIATSVSTKALKPRHAILLAATMNFVGAMTFTGVAKTITKDIVDPYTLQNGSVVILAALISAIAWNLITWYFGIPSSSSHAIIGSIAGAAIAAAGFGALNYKGFIKIIEALLIFTSSSLCSRLYCLYDYQANV